MAIKLFTLAEITVATAGTEQQVSTSEIPITTIVFTADPTNTGYIYVGDSSVSSTRAAMVLAAGQAGSMSQDMGGLAGGDEYYLSDLWVDTSVNGNKVYVSYIKRR